MLCALMFAGTPHTLYAQQSYILHIKGVDKDSLGIAPLQLQQSFTSSSALRIYVSKLATLLQRKGYVAASVDSIIDTGNKITAHVYFGEYYKNLQLTISDGDRPVLARLGWPVVAGKSDVPITEYYKYSNQILNYFQDNGYPFASVTIDSINTSQRQMSGLLRVEKGYFYKFDSIRVLGDARISKNFLYHYLSIKPGEPYNNSKLLKLNQYLMDLSYLQQVQPWSMTMLNTGSMLNLYLTPKRSNQVNILAGFLPANQQIGGKVLLTVDANLLLKNAFGSGETVGVIWQQLQPKSPRLNLQYTQPYLFKSPFGTDINFQLFKKDSAFLNIQAHFGLAYGATADRTAKLFIQSRQTNVLSVDTLLIRRTKQLPEVTDVSMINLGVSYDLSTLNYRLNPRTGGDYSFIIIAGSKTIKKNNTITQLKDPFYNYASLYDTINLSSYQLSFQLKAAQYFKTGKQSTWKIAVQSGWYQSPTYFRNELFQIGGYKTLRGFDEESIYTNRYLVGTVEYRYLVGQNSNFFIFSDGGSTFHPNISTAYQYISGGIGMSLETKSGVFNISYATGKRNDLSFDIRQAKIHIGFVSIF